MDRRKPRVDRDDQTVAAPEEVLGLEIYTDDQIAQWDADDSWRTTSENALPMP